jgi:hypothetical protein
VQVDAGIMPLAISTASPAPASEIIPHPAAGFDDPSPPARSANAGLDDPSPPARAAAGLLDGSPEEEVSGRKTRRTPQPRKGFTLL